jgi:hypothetical protein
MGRQKRDGLGNCSIRKVTSCRHLDAKDTYHKSIVLLLLVLLCYAAVQVIPESPILNTPRYHKFRGVVNVGTYGSHFNPSVSTLVNRFSGYIKSLVSG